VLTLKNTLRRRIKCQEARLDDVIKAKEDECKYRNMKPLSLMLNVLIPEARGRCHKRIRERKLRLIALRYWLGLCCVMGYDRFDSVYREYD